MKISEIPFNKAAKYAVISIIALVLLYTQFFVLFDHDSVNNDVRNLFYITNPDSLDDNLLAQYSYSKWSSATFYLSHIYIIFSHVIDFIFLTKFVTLVMFFIAAYYIFKLGRLIENKRFAYILLIVFTLHTWTMPFYQGGLSRSFAFPLLAAFLYYLIKRERSKVAIVLLLQAMFYPPVFLICGGVFALSLINIERKTIELKLRKNAIIIVFGILGLLAIFIPQHFITYGITEQVEFDDAIESQAFYDGGRYPIFRGEVPFTDKTSTVISTIVSIFNPGVYRPFTGNAMFMLGVVSVILFFIFRKQMKQLPKEIYYIAISSIGLQIIAGILLFKLYIPQRYVIFSIPFFLIIIFSYALYEFSKNQRWKFMLLPILLILLLFYMPKVENYYMQCDENELYDFLEALPDNTLLAGYPPDLDCVALYGKKDPFLMNELNLPFFSDYFEIIKQRNFDFFTAYYSENKEGVDLFCKANGITHMIIDKNNFKPEFLARDRVYIHPFSDHIKQITEGRQNFYLKNPENVLFEQKDRAVVECS